MMTKATKSDYFPEDLFPNGVSFTYPDHMVRLCDYKTQLNFENVEQFRVTRERIPASAVTKRLASEFGITEEQVHQYTLIGNFVHYDRELRDLSPEQLREHEVANTPTPEQQAQFDAEYGDELRNDIQSLLDENARYQSMDAWLDELLGEG